MSNYVSERRGAHFIFHLSGEALIKKYTRKLLVIYNFPTTIFLIWKFSLLMFVML